MLLVILIDSYSLNGLNSETSVIVYFVKTKANLMMERFMSKY